MFTSRRPRRSDDPAARPGAARTGRNVVSLRSRIVDAARRLCFAAGVEGVSARKLAAEVGCSAAAIYLHFTSIEHVLHEIRMEGHALLVDYLRSPTQDMNALDRLCAMQAAYHRFGLENPNYFRVMFLSRVDGGPLGELVTAEGASLDVVCAEAARGLDRGEIRAGLDPLVIANACWMSIHGLTSMIVSGHAAVTAPGLEAQLVRAVTDATAAWLRPATAYEHVGTSTASMPQRHTAAPQSAEPLPSTPQPAKQRPRQAKERT